MLKLIMIALAGVIAMCLGYYFLEKSYRVVLSGKRGKQMKELETEFWIMAVLLVAFIARIIAGVSYFGNDTDMNCFIAWGDMIFQDGISNFYTSDAFTDYPPGYMYILYVIGAIRHAFGIVWNSNTSVLLTKLPAILADIGTGYLIYRVGKKYFKNNGAAILAAFYLFCPAVIMDSAVWGQTDSVFTLLIAIMCYLITEKKLIPSYFVFAVAILIKPQSLIFTPVLIFGIIDQVFLEDFHWKKFWTNLGLGIVAILLIGLLMLPFGFQEAFAQYSDTLGSYEYASVNAYNIWTLFGLNWSSQFGTFMGLTYKTWGTVFIVLTVLVAAVIHYRAKNNPSRYYFTGAFIVSSVFLLSVRMHERYIFPALVLLLLAYAMRPKKLILFGYMAVSALSFLNMGYVEFIYDLNNFNAKEPATLWISFGMLVFFGYLIFVAVTQYHGYVSDQEFKKIPSSGGVPSKKHGSQAKKSNKQKKKSAITPSAAVVKMVKADWIALGIIVVVYAVVAFVRLGNMHAPTTPYSIVEQGDVILDLGETKEIGQIWDYLGYQNNPKYNLEYTEDLNSGWTSLYQDAQNEDGSVDDSGCWDAGSVFCWNSTDLNISARYLQITPSANNMEDSIMELLLTDTQGNVIEPVNADDYANLFDEQEEFEGRANVMNGTYFDEIYHGRTAYEMIHKLYCYENTHPPMGKEFIALGVLLFGMNPFGWRFMGTLFGVLMLPIIYLFAKKFFKETWISIVTTLLFTFDFMHFVQTRIATIDVFVTLFIMLSYYFMYCYLQKSFFDTELKKTFIPLGLCGIAMGFSWACKWTGIYSAAGLCILFFAHMYKRYTEYRYAVLHPSGSTEGISHAYIRKNFRPFFWKTIGFCCIFFLVVPALIYILSYIPFSDGSDRGLIAKVIESQKTMYDYHSGLDAEHAYSSTWYQWPIMYRPMWYYSGFDGNLREGISAFGNPLVWWAGIPAALYMVYLLIREKDRKAGFLLIGYLSQYAPWFLVSRIVFIYHYFPSVPFVTVMLGYSMYRLANWQTAWKKRMQTGIYVYVALAIGLFILFYPVLSGLGIEPEFATKYLKWFETWVLVDTWTVIS
ncbi:MAG: glycosyltransferase family 39 protein [Eubacteriales bacterium]|nr:glycosyltransferase family 39 protein [Eubacteriales bacterium]